MQAEDSIRQNQSTSSKNTMTSRKWGHNSMMAPPQSLQSEDSRPLWGLVHHPGPPLQLWGGQDLDGPGPSQWVQSIKIGPRGPPIAPTDSGPWRMACGP
ncbi:hypothetical protein O181_008586 [Austropuccinia psidii MF-1]|uniref:Uncharacterized protein n=1 Tax=Austropuccinia psidii MF-1 TaxID=1389203 RepID=A0A9Q3BMT1_9BASI|nr:hypothetical protein [Austropuccinia psidii MF-1]